MYKTLAMLSLLAALAAPLGCDDGSEQARSAGASLKEALPEGLVLSAAPEGALGVASVRSSAKEGQVVVVRGVIGGREEPIAQNRAILTLLDESVKTCDQTPSDGCKTPWDACCEPPEVIAANSVAVQVVDGDGRVLSASLAGAGGVKPLSRVVVKGRYRLSPDGKSALIEATGIHVEAGA